MGHSEVAEIMLVKEARNDCKEGNVVKGYFLHEEMVYVLFPNGPLLKVVALGRVDLQWGLVVG